MSYDELRLYAEMVFDVQQFRISAENKIRSAIVDPTFIGQALKQYEATEHTLSLAMRRCMRKTVAPSITAWQKSQPGIGEHLLARLLATVGDPRWAEPKHWEGTGSERTLIDDEPHARTVSQLWSYCGVGDPTRVRRKGMTADEGAALGNPRAKMVVHLLAEACIKQQGDYRKVYEQDRFNRGDVNGPEGWTSGSALTKGHSHNRALRRVKKQILKDLWIVAGGQPEGEPQTAIAPGGES